MTHGDRSIILFVCFLRVHHSAPAVAMIDTSWHTYLMTYMSHPVMGCCVCFGFLVEYQFSSRLILKCVLLMCVLTPLLPVFDTFLMIACAEACVVPVSCFTHLCLVGQYSPSVFSAFPLFSCQLVCCCSLVSFLLRVPVPWAPHVFPVCAWFSFSTYSCFCHLLHFVGLHLPALVFSQFSF